MGTFLLVLTVLMVAVHKKSGAGKTAPIAIGWAVLVCHLQLIPYTGCGINPARSFGPMVVDAFGGMNKWHRGWWVYYTAPFLGSALATGIYYFVFAEDDVEDNEESGDHTGVRESTFGENTPNATGTALLQKPSSEAEGAVDAGFHARKLFTESADEIAMALQQHFGLAHGFEVRFEAKRARR